MVFRRAVVLAAALSGCGPMMNPVPDLSITASPKTIVADGEVSKISISVVDAMEKPRTGKVTLSASAGVFTSGDTQVQLTLKADGSASDEFSCDVRQDADCVDSARIEARWDGVDKQFLVQVIRITLKAPTP